MSYLLAIVALIGWSFALDYRKQNKNLRKALFYNQELKDGYRNAVQSFIRAWQERGEDIKRLKQEACDDPTCHIDFPGVYKEMCERGAEVKRLRNELKGKRKAPRISKKAP